MNTPPCSSAADACAPANCHWRCALQVIDDLLGQPGAASGEEVDALLDLRWHLSKRTDAEVALRLFCELRRSMEQWHYLPFFRIRRWMENNIVVQVRGCPAAEPQSIKLRLDCYCVEAVRRVCLCTAANRGVALLVPRVQFDFQEVTAAVPRLEAVAA
jgi:hypothetical protein